MTRADRSQKIVEAIEAMPRALARALTAEAGGAPREGFPPDQAAHGATLAAWAEVERLGATIHRQARLLAGKSKGG